LAKASETRWRGPKGIALLALLSSFVVWLGVSGLAPDPTTPGPMEDPLKGVVKSSNGQPLPAEVKKDPQRTPIELLAKGHSLEIELWDESAVRRVPGGLVRFQQGGLENGKVLYEFPVEANGLASLKKIQAGQYKLEVEAEGFFPPNPIYIEIPFAKKRLRLEMEAALLIFGIVRDAEGNFLNDGFVRMSNRQSGNVMHCSVDGEGRFSSTALVGGVYSIAWVPEERSPTRLGSALEAAGAPGDRLELEITVE